MSWNFALILFLLLVVTGIVWALDMLVLRKRRARRVLAARAQFGSTAIGDAQETERLRSEAVAKANHVPWYIEYCVSFFPVILFVFVLRSFLVEPFRIPSGSMLPTLESGDLILVNKYDYGLRLPVIDKKVVNIGTPQRGDVIVFRYPVDPTVDYIKRVVAVAGDEIDYIDKRLYINGTEVTNQRDGDYYEPDRVAYVSQFDEKLGDVNHKILMDSSSGQEFTPIWQFPHMDACQYDRHGVRCKVPAGNYFAMGDNRDNSADSRYWGFVPDSNIIGKAFFIWMNFSEPSRIGRFH